MRNWINLITEFQQHDVEKILDLDGGSNEPPEPPVDDGDPWGGGEEPSYNFHNINVVKRYFYDKSFGGGHPLGARKKWWVQSFDGNFQRGTFIVDGKPSLFPDMARIMNIWDSYFDHEAIFVQESGRQTQPLQLIWLDGRDISPPVPIPASDSPNANHFNDKHWIDTVLKPMLDRMR